MKLVETVRIHNILCTVSSLTTKVAEILGMVKQKS